MVKKKKLGIAIADLVEEIATESGWNLWITEFSSFKSALDSIDCQVTLSDLNTHKKIVNT